MGTWTTTPTTATAGAAITAALWNSDVRDLGNAFGAWTSYTPTVGGTGWAIGNGTATGAYCRVGDLIHFRASVTWGSSSTFGSAALTLTVPVTAAASATFMGRGVDSGSMVGLFFILSASTTTLTTRLLSTTATADGAISTAPFTWASGDSLDVTGTYEA